MEQCLANAFFFGEYFPCSAEFNAYLACVTNLGPAVENWSCTTGFPPVPQSPNCDEEIVTLYTCAGY